MAAMMHFLGKLAIDKVSSDNQILCRSMLMEFFIYFKASVFRHEKERKRKKKIESVMTVI